MSFLSGPLSGDVELINEVSKVKSGKNDRSQMFQSSVSEVSYRGSSHSEMTKINST